MRFCRLDTSTDQADEFPPSVCVSINGKMFPLPNPIPGKNNSEPKRPPKPIDGWLVGWLIIMSYSPLTWSYPRVYLYKISPYRDVSSHRQACHVSIHIYCREQVRLYYNCS